MPALRRYLLLLILLIVGFIIYQISSLLVRNNDFQVHPVALPEPLSLSREEYLVTDLQLILRIGEIITGKGKVILITVINDAYLPFAQSWLCNTVYMDVHQQVLIVTMDTQSRDKLANQFTDIHVVSLSNKDRYNGNQKFSHAGYMNLIVIRTQIIMALLKENMEVLLFEVDCVWLANPIPEVKKEARGYDLVGTMVTNRPGIIAGGFLFMKPTKAMVTLWDMLTERLSDLQNRISALDAQDRLDDKDNDQTYFTRLLSQNYAGVRVNTLPSEKFADGRWYKLDPDEREELRPIIINNNWLSENKYKMRRARKFRHWFIKGRSEKCNLRLVNQTVY